jgi:hypothetical protein
VPSQIDRATAAFIGLIYGLPYAMTDFEPFFLNPALALFLGYLSRQFFAI